METHLVKQKADVARNYLTSVLLLDPVICSEVYMTKWRVVVLVFLNSDLYAEERKHSPLSLKALVGRANQSRNLASEPSAGSTGAGEREPQCIAPLGAIEPAPPCEGSHVRGLSSFCRST